MLIITSKLPDELTNIVCVVAPLLHTLPVIALEVNITLAPAQKEGDEDDEITGIVGVATTVNVILAGKELQPFTEVV